MTTNFDSYDDGREFFQVTGVAPGKEPAPGSRVKATIIPQKKGADGKPLPPPAAPPVTLKPDKGPGAGG